MGPGSSGAGFNYSCSSKCGRLGLRNPYEGTRTKKPTDFIISGRSCLEYKCDGECFRTRPGWFTTKMIPALYENIRHGTCIYSPVGACESWAGSYYTEVQGISFVGSTSEVCCPHPLCNLQNLCPVPPYYLLQARSDRKQGFTKYMVKNQCAPQTRHSYFRPPPACNK